MLHELSKRNFLRIANMIDKHTNLEAQAVIAGNNPGWVFVEDIDDPQSALLWSQGNAGFYLMGDESNHVFNNALVPFIEDELTPGMKQRGYSHFEVSGAHKKWDPTIRQLFADKDVRSWVQRVYTYTHKTPPKAMPIPRDFAIVPVDKKLLSSSYDNSAHIAEEIEKFWHSVRVFLHDGFAYCAVHKNNIASICYTSFRTGKSFALGVETFEPYRKIGLAQALTAECIAHALREKAVPYWDCMESNTGSVKTAEGLGFKRQWDYLCYGYKIDS